MWQVDVMDATGTISQTYTDANPGGITGSIETSKDGNGDCLTAKLSMIPNQTALYGRDYVKITVDTDAWYGYVTTGVNPDDNTVVEVECQGAKTLLADTVIDTWWFKGTPDANGLVDHHQIVASLEQFLPAYVEASISNDASTSTGNKPPITAKNAKFGDVLDAIVGTATDETYCWGVDGNRTVFIKPVGVSTVDLRAVNPKLVQFKTQNVEQLVTAVKFVFNLPKGFFWDDANTVQRIAEDFNLTTGGSPYHQNGSAGARTIDYLYEDASLVSTYGRHTKIVPILLTESLLTRQTITDFLAAVTDSSLGVGSFQTQSGSTALADIESVLSDGDDSTYIESTAKSATLFFNMQHPTYYYPGFPLDDVVGVQFNVDYTANGSSELGWVCADWHVQDAGDAGEPRRDAESAYSGATLSGARVRVRLYRRALADYNSDPTADAGAGVPYPTGDIGRSLSQFTDAYDTGTGRATFKVYEMSVLRLNTGLLDALGATYIASPGSYPSVVTVQSDVGNVPFVKVLKLDGSTVVTESVKRVTRTAGVEEGVLFRLDLAYDERRQNAVLQRIAGRDQASLVGAANFSVGGF